MYSLLNNDKESWVAVEMHVHVHVDGTSPNIL